MLIDWFTVAAQTLNFLILVWLMKRFLYKPILRAIDAREERIAAQLADADARQADAKKERDEFRRKNETFEEQRAALLRGAAEEVAVERQRLLDAAREAADAMSAQRQDALRNEARELRESLRQRTQREVFAIARKTLTDVAETSLEERAIDTFLSRLNALDSEAKEHFANALNTASEPALLRSAFELPTEQRETLQRGLNEGLSADIPIRFEVAPNLIAGIELSANGQELAWSIADYLGSLEESVTEVLKATPQPTASAEPQAGVPELSTAPP